MHPQQWSRRIAIFLSPRAITVDDAAPSGYRLEEFRSNVWSDARGKAGQRSRGGVWGANESMHGSRSRYSVNLVENLCPLRLLRRVRIASRRAALHLRSVVRR